VVKPDLSQLTLSQLAELVRGNPRTVRRRCEDAGVKPSRQDGRALFYRPYQALEAYYTLGGEQGLDPQAERARLDRARAELAEHQLRVATGEYGPVADFEFTSVAFWSGVNQRFQGMGTRLALDLAGEASPPACQSLVDAAVREIMGEIADLRVIRTKAGRKQSRLDALLLEYRQKIHALLSQEDIFTGGGHVE
jgi:hypothetical protein